MDQYVVKDIYTFSSGGHFILWDPGSGRNRVNFHDGSSEDASDQ